MSSDLNQAEIEALAKKRRTRLFVAYNIALVVAVIANLFFAKYNQNSYAQKHSELTKQLEELKTAQAELKTISLTAQTPATTENKTLGVIDKAEKQLKEAAPITTTIASPSSTTTLDNQITITKKENSSSKIPVYEKADTTSEIVATLAQNEALPFISETSEWYLVDISSSATSETDFKTGWISKLKTKKTLPNENHF